MPHTRSPPFRFIKNGTIIFIVALFIFQFQYFSFEGDKRNEVPVQIGNPPPRLFRSDQGNNAQLLTATRDLNSKATIYNNINTNTNININSNMNTKTNDADAVEKLLPKDIELIISSTGIAKNLLTHKFISIPKWLGVQKSDEENTACLLLPSTGLSVWLLPSGWEKPTTTRTKCPEPSGGQLPVPHGKTPEISILIFSNDNTALTIECILALFHAASEVPSIEFIILNQGGSQNNQQLVDFLQRLDAYFVVVIKQARLHQVISDRISLIAKAASFADGKYFLFIDNGVLVEKNTLRAMYDTFFSHPNVGIVSPKFIQSNGIISQAGQIIFSNTSIRSFGHGEMMDESYIDFVRELEVADSSCMMVSQEAFSKLKLYSSDYGVRFFNDADAANKIRLAGFRLLFQPFAVVVRLEGNKNDAISNKIKANARSNYMYKWETELSCHFPIDVIKQRTDTITPATRLSSIRLLFIDWIAPEVDRDSGSIRTYYLLQIFKAMRMHVTFVPIDMNRERIYHDRLRFMGIEVSPIEELIFQKFSFDQSCRFDIVIVSRRMSFDSVHEILSRNCPYAPVVFDTVDLHFIREMRGKQFADQHANEPELLQAIFGANFNQMTDLGAITEESQHEMEYIRNSAVTVVVSHVEAIEIEKILPQVNVLIISNIHFLEPTYTPYAKRFGAVFTGNFNHLPNRDAILFFTNEILPLVVSDNRIKEDFVFNVVGANQIPEQVKAIDGKTFNGIPRVKIHGYIEDLREFFSNMRVSVVPLRWGAGVKGKVNSAMKYGVPVICTTIAEEGMYLKDGEDALISDDPVVFAQKTVLAYTDEIIWNKLVANGYKNIETYFSFSRAVEGTMQIFSNLLRIGDVKKALENGKAALLTTNRCKGYDELH